MKKIFTTIAIVMLLIANCYGQTDPCVGKMYNYEFPLPNFVGSYRYVCTDDPAWYAAHNGDRVNPPVKWPSGSTVYTCWDANILAAGSPSGCIDPSALSDCIENAMCQWSKVCFNEVNMQRGTDPTDGCCIPIVYTTDLRDLGLRGATPSEIASTAAYCDPISSNVTGEIVCDISDRGTVYTTKVFLNATATFQNTVTLVICPKSSNCTVSTPYVKNICTSIFHEFGHLLGLQHTDLVIPPYLQPCDNGNSKDDIMFSAQDKDVGCSDLRTKLSQVDKCAIANLYCKGHGNFSGITHKNQTMSDPPPCDNSSVKVPITSKEGSFIKVFPNPASKSLNVAFGNTDQMLKGKFHLVILDILGKVLYTETHQEDERSNSSFQLDLSKLSSGSYILEYFDDKFFSEKLFYVVK